MINSHSALREVASHHALLPMVRKLARHSRLGSAEVDALLALPCRTADINPGFYLIREGERVDSCIAMLSGFAYRSKIAGNGARQILAIQLPGDLVELQSSMLDKADSSVHALTRIEAAYVPRQAILDVAEAYPAIGRALWRDTLVDGSVSREWIVNVGRRGARQRIAHLLCEMAVRQKAAGLCDGSQVDWPITQEQLGDAIGLTAVHVNRTIQTLRREGLISTGKRSVTIVDWPGLQQAGDFSSAYLHEAALQPGWALPIPA